MFFRSTLTQLGFAALFCLASVACAATNHVRAVPADRLAEESFPEFITAVELDEISRTSRPVRLVRVEARPLSTFESADVEAFARDYPGLGPYLTYYGIEIHVRNTSGESVMIVIPRGLVLHFADAQDMIVATFDRAHRDTPAFASKTAVRFDRSAPEYAAVVPPDSDAAIALDMLCIEHKRDAPVGSFDRVRMSRTKNRAVLALFDAVDRLNQWLATATPEAAHRRSPFLRAVVLTSIKDAEGKLMVNPLAYNIAMWTAAEKATRSSIESRLLPLLASLGPKLRENLRRELNVHFGTASVLLKMARLDSALLKR